MWLEHLSEAISEERARSETPGSIPVSGVVLSVRAESVSPAGKWTQPFHCYGENHGITSISDKACPAWKPANDTRDGYAPRYRDGVA